MAKSWSLFGVGIAAFILVGCAGTAEAPTSSPTEPVPRRSSTPSAPTYTPELATPTPELPVQLTEVGSNEELGSPVDLFVSNDYAYIADSHNGLRVVDVSDPADPQQVGDFDPPGSTAGKGVYFAAPYVYLADGLGLLTLEVSDPATPTEVGFYDSRGFAIKVQVVGDYAYVAGREGGLNVADGYAYVANGNQGLRVLRVDLN